MAAENTSPLKFPKGREPPLLMIRRLNRTPSNLSDSSVAMTSGSCLSPSASPTARRQWGSGTIHFQPDSPNRSSCEPAVPQLLLSPRRHHSSGSSGSPFTRGSPSRSRPLSITVSGNDDLRKEAEEKTSAAADATPLTPKELMEENGFLQRKLDTLQVEQEDTVNSQQQLLMDLTTTKRELHRATAKHDAERIEWLRRHDELRKENESLKHRLEAAEKLNQIMAMDLEDTQKRLEEERAMKTEFERRRRLLELRAKVGSIRCEPAEEAMACAGQGTLQERQFSVGTDSASEKANGFSTSSSSSSSSSPFSTIDISSPPASGRSCRLEDMDADELRMRVVMLEAQLAKEKESKEKALYEVELRVVMLGGQLAAAKAEGEEIAVAAQRKVDALRNEVQRLKGKSFDASMSAGCDVVAEISSELSRARLEIERLRLDQMTNNCQSPSALRWLFPGCLITSPKP